MILYYNRKGEPITLVEWAQLLNTERQVCDDTIGDVRVSTVWLGLDHSTPGDGPPIIFETMVFGGALDGEQERYSTEAEALAGHAATLERVRAAA